MAHSTLTTYTAIAGVQAQLQNAARYWGLPAQDAPAEIVAFTAPKGKLAWLFPAAQNFVQVVELTVTNLDRPALLRCTIKSRNVANIFPGANNRYYLQRADYNNLVDNADEIAEYDGLAAIPCTDANGSYFYFCLYKQGSDPNIGNVVRNRTGLEITLIGPGGGGPPGDTAGLRIPSH